MSGILTKEKPVKRIPKKNVPYQTKFLSYSFLTDTQESLKRSMDVLFSLFVFVFIISWLFPIIGILIKLDTKGPIFFRQLRHGKNNIPFYCYKFRTMHANSEADTRQATEDDPRVTQMGKFLRKSSLDELPQFFNVFLGEMSVVGPRPHAIPMNNKFSEEIDNFMYRHAVKPGITGLAQAKGFRGETKDFFDIYSRCKLDIFYVNNWSPWLDFKIMIWTVYSLFQNNSKVY
ncbi:sugar transferase [Pleomorphovibrio marinus]|uniref:sugar transferase n=1 Tax=Pleomorphovibrio marinus TaxID=2164132 RepID=UPI000E0BFA1A|nr:sugar transferase [Pleomorphovibrio marinus]